jgi:hypothetical protein
LHGALLGYASPRFVYGVVAAAWLAIASGAVAGLVFAILGAIDLARRDGMKTIGILGCAAGSAGFACGFNDESDVTRYFLPALVVLGVFGGIGVAWLRATRYRLAVAPVMLLAIVTLLVMNRDLYARPMDGGAEADVNAVLAATPANAILVSNWTLAPPLAYASYVEHRAGDRVVVAAWHDEVVDAIPGWSKRRPVYLVERREGHVALSLITH